MRFIYDIGLLNCRWNWFGIEGDDVKKGMYLFYTLVIYVTSAYRIISLHIIWCHAIYTWSNIQITPDCAEDGILGECYVITMAVDAIRIDPVIFALFYILLLSI